MKKVLCALFSFLLWIPFTVLAQELNCKVTVNTQQVQGTNTEAFKSLEAAITSFMNERNWTNDQYALNERISCALLLTVKKYTEDGNFTGELTIQSNRPVHNSSYNSPVLNFKDNNISFNYKSFDQLEFRADQIDNNLTALLAYYAYLIIGLDLDTMSPMGGTSILQNAEAVVNSAQSLAEPGWKAYDDSKNRHAIITDYMDEAMKPIRVMMYDYHRLGLDEMGTNMGRGRAQVTTSLEELQKASKAKSMSALPQIMTETKRDELINIYSKAPSTEKEKVYEILSDINPSLNSDWDKVKSTAN